jgi:hypothetical protein
MVQDKVLGTAAQNFPHLSISLQVVLVSRVCHARAVPAICAVEREGNGTQSLSNGLVRGEEDVYEKACSLFADGVFRPRDCSHKGPGPGAIDVVQTQQAQTHAARWVEHRQH